MKTLSWSQFLRDFCRRITDRKCIAFMVSTWLLYNGYIDKFVWLATFGVFTGAKVYESLHPRHNEKKEQNP